MVGMAQLASAPDCGSGGRGFESLYPPCMGDAAGRVRRCRYGIFARRNSGLSPSGKAQDFDSCIRRFKSG